MNGAGERAPGAPAVVLESAHARAVILPGEGGLVADLVIDGDSILARTPWASSVIPAVGLAADEDTWVRQWRGGWQPCLPNVGEPDATATPREGFHGAASQAAWRVVDSERDAILMSWNDEAGLSATRRLQLHPDGIALTATATNGGDTRAFAVAEHVVLGSALLAPLREGGGVRLSAEGMLSELAEDGSPSSVKVVWPGDDWDRVTLSTPARAAALTPTGPHRVALITPMLTATIEWEGLPHALLWEELAQSDHAPWGGSVMALGIEPASVSFTGGPRLARPTLLRGETKSWSVRLRIRRRSRDAAAPQPSAVRISAPTHASELQSEHLTIERTTHDIAGKRTDNRTGRDHQNRRPTRH